jgi:hypothetical protein
MQKKKNAAAMAVKMGEKNQDTMMGTMPCSQAGRLRTFWDTCLACRVQPDGKVDAHSLDQDVYTGASS